jgi:hypothetical protein
MIIKGHFSAGPFSVQPPKTPLGHTGLDCRRPLLARSAGVSPSTQPQPAAATRSKAWRGFAQSGQAAQDGVRWKLSGLSGPKSRDGPFEEAKGETL